MAHYKRHRPRSNNTHGARWTRRQCDARPDYAWMRHWPRWWDIVFHTRPQRRRQRECVVAVMHGADPDGIAWPLGNHKPHTYYW